MYTSGLSYSYSFHHKPGTSRLLDDSSSFPTPSSTCYAFHFARLFRIVCFITRINDSEHRGRRPFSRATQVNFVITSEKNHCLSISSHHRLSDPAQMTTHLIRIFLSFSAWLEKYCGWGVWGREWKINKMHRVDEALILQEWRTIPTLPRLHRRKIFFPKKTTGESACSKVGVSTWASVCVCVVCACVCAFHAIKQIFL